jgi:radical SAM-linked protein
MCATNSACRSRWRVIRVAKGEFRLRIRYGKVGRLRWLSHLEVLHALERCVRRAGLAYAVTQGFSPHMKVAFGPALPVGTAGDNEYYDIWLTRYTKAEELLGLLTAAMPEDLAPSKAAFVADAEPSLAAALRIAKYEVDVTGKESSAQEVHAALTSLVDSGTLAVTHKGKNKVFDLARSLPEETRASQSADGSRISLTVRIGPEGSLRPEVLVKAALEAASLDASVVRVTRTDTLIETEEGIWARPL